MDYEPKHKIDVSDATTQTICETYIKMEKEGINVDYDNLYFRLKTNGIVEDYDFLQPIIEYLQLIHVPGFYYYKNYLNDIPESAYNWKRQRITPKEFQIFLCHISNLAIFYARKDIIPDISNKYILAWRYQYESFTGFKLNKDKIGYMIKILNEADLTNIKKKKQQVNGKWSTLHTIVLGRRHPGFSESILKWEDRADIQKKCMDGIITDYKSKEPIYDKWYGCWLLGKRYADSMAEVKKMLYQH